MGTRAAGRPRPRPQGSRHSPGSQPSPGGGAGREPPHARPAAPAQRRRRRAGPLAELAARARRSAEFGKSSRSFGGSKGWESGGAREKNPPLAVERGRGKAPVPFEPRWVEEVGAGQAGGTRALRARDGRWPASGPAGSPGAFCDPGRRPSSGTAPRPPPPWPSAAGSSSG